jgi:acyl-CoA dehydrogenase
MTNAPTADLSVDEDLQAMLSDVVSGFSGPHVRPDPDAVWSTLREVGVARLTAPEATGGSGAGWVEAAATLRIAAGAGVAVPYAETDLLAGPLRRAAGVDDSSDYTTTVALLDSAGTAHHVPWAGATTTVVCVRPVGDTYQLGEVPTDDVAINTIEGISGVPTGSVTAGEGIAWSPVPTAAVEAYVLRGALARALQCVGAMDGMLASAIEYATDRSQFGRALAKFQSVQNLVVDIAAESVLARAAVDTALADALTSGLDGELSQFRVAVARSVVSQALAVAVRNVHQVHGAMGTTQEHHLHRVTLPALQWRGEFGSPGFWEGFLSRAAVAGGMDGAWPMVAEGTRVQGAASRYLDLVCRTSTS